VTRVVDGSALAILFQDARTHTVWQDRPVSEELLRAAWDLAKMGPTSANSSPARIVFVTSREAKERLKAALSEGNVAKTMAAPATAIFGYDLAFYERLPDLFPHADARSWFVGKDKLIETTAFRNASLQGGYFILSRLRPGSRLRTHVRLRQCQGRRSFLRRDGDPFEFPLQSRIRRSLETSSAQQAPFLRRSVSHRLNYMRPTSRTLSERTG
jgi:hypothetical protein